MNRLIRDNSWMRIYSMLYFDEYVRVNSNQRSIEEEHNIRPHDTIEYCNCKYQTRLFRDRSLSK